MACLQLFLILCSFPCHSFGFSPAKFFTGTNSRALQASSDVNGIVDQLSSQSYLSHVMLKVPSVDQAVAYWIEKGGIVRVQKEKPDSENGGLSSAMIELGCSSKNNDVASPCFALELVAINKFDYQLGNALSYIGISMLLQFQNNLLGLVQGEKPESQGEEPNGIKVVSSASAPGDFLARFVLRSQDLDATEDFYCGVLGMENKARDEKMLCVRYDNDCFAAGFPTTLIFEYSEINIEKGDCFDHLVIATDTKVEEIYNHLAESCTIFMKPTKMFGRDVLGLLDPNGYKVIIASC